MKSQTRQTQPQETSCSGLPRFCRDACTVKQMSSTTTKSFQARSLSELSEPKCSSAIFKTRPQCLQFLYKTKRFTFALFHQQIVNMSRQYLSTWQHRRYLVCSRCICRVSQNYQTRTILNRDQKQKNTRKS